MLKSSVLLHIKSSKVTGSFGKNSCNLITECWHLYVNIDCFCNKLINWLEQNRWLWAYISNFEGMLTQKETVLLENECRHKIYRQVIYVLHYTAVHTYRAGCYVQHFQVINEILRYTHVEISTKRFILRLEHLIQWFALPDVFWVPDA